MVINYTDNVEQMLSISLMRIVIYLQKKFILF